MADPFDLERFVSAQAGCYDVVVSELRAGHKRSHWIWFIFPQLKGLGMSSRSQFYGLQDLAEAHAYWKHPVLGTRLRECFALLLAHQTLSAHDILGDPDDMKLRSCATLFWRATKAPICDDVLRRFFGGEEDGGTVSLLGKTIEG